MNAASQQPDDGDSISVLIVGGGLVGLSTSLFLSWHGISSLLVERHPGTAIHPRALGWTPRTMELFRSVGVEEAIRKIEPPIPEGSNVPLVESLVGEELDSLQEDIGAYLSDASSPMLGSGTAQDMLEPILRARAEQLGGKLCFGTELVDFAQDETGITATIREHESSSTRTVRSPMGEARANMRFPFDELVQSAQGVPIGALVIRLVHDHTQFRLPQPPGVLAVEQTTAAAIVQAIERAAGHLPSEEE